MRSLLSISTFSNVATASGRLASSNCAPCRTPRCGWLSSFASSSAVAFGMASCCTSSTAPRSTAAAPAATFIEASRDGALTVELDSDGNLIRCELAPEVNATWTADQLGGPDGLGVRLAIMTGARRGEIIGLQWSGVDFSTRTLHICQSMSETAGSRKLKTTKTQATRHVAIDGATAKALLTRWNELSRQAADFMVTFGPDDYVLAPHAGVRMPIRGDRLYKAYRELAKALDITDMRFHDLRHGHATMLLQDGADLATVAQRIGDDPVTVARFYVHGEMKQQRKAVGNLVERLAGTGG